jgi:3-oxoacyl-[acyl-carrier-protein] synthase II
MRIVQRGDADIMIAGGTDALASPLWLTAFILLGALSTRPVEPTRASCPFDARRDGFVMGEGAGMIVMETLESALRRGARIYAELAGYGTSSNAYRVTDPPADGSGAVSAMQRAIADAGSRTDGIDYIHAHGTSTPMNDATETAAIKTLFGDHAYAVPISSIKSMIGHLISGAGALNIISTALTIDTETIPPTINYEQSDPSCDLDYVPNQGRTRAVRQTLTNAFGFGGQNVSIVLKKYAH